MKILKQVLSERSPESDFEIFAPLMKMSSFERACYESIYACLNEANPDLVIYIRSDPETCLKRIATRGRASEKGLSIQYLSQVHKQHEEYVKSLSKEKRSFVIIDGNQSKEQVLEDILSAVRGFLLKNGVVP